MSLLNPESPLARLLNGPIRPGIVAWIGVRAERRQPVIPVALAELEAGRGIRGDHARGRTRQVTLMQAEHLMAIAAHLGRPALDPALLRRNILVRGVNLLALKNRSFRLGTAILRTTGECHPCSRMEEVLGPGGYNAVRGLGGITASVVTGGSVRVDDVLDVIADPALP